MLRIRYTAPGLIGLIVWLAATVSGSNRQAVKSISLPASETHMRLAASSEESLTFDFELGSLDASTIHSRGGDFTLLTSAGLSRSHRAGEPALPIVNRIICIPVGAELTAGVVDVRTEEISLYDLGIDLPLMPAQPPLSKSDDPASVPFERNDAVYNRPGYYSLPEVQVEILGTMRSVRLARVSVAPVAYNPTENKLRAITSGQIRVTISNADWKATTDLLRRQSSAALDPVLGLTANYGDFLAQTQAAAEIGASTYPVKYLIVADRMFESQLEPFIEWKTRRGFNVITAYTDVIGYTTTDIHDYIEGLYNAGTPEDPAPSFVLLVGDVQQIPAFDGVEGNHVTDLYYCEFTGDILPDMYYGRFSAQTIAQLQPQIDKTLEYEQYLMPDPSYLANVTLVAGVDPTYAPDYANGQINYGTSYYFDAAHGITPNVWLYPDSDDPSAADDIIQTISDGIGLYNYTAHCAHPGHAQPSFTTGDIPSLTNYHKYLLGIGNCCAANTFGDNFSSPCFGEAFLQAEDKGGIGYIGASDNTYWDEDYYWAVGAGPVIGSGPTYEETGVGAYDQIFHDHGETVTPYNVTNGAIQVAGNLGVDESASPVADYYWEVYHLMGDPSVMTYLGVPASNTVSHATQMAQSAAEFHVEADPGSYVGLSEGGTLLLGGAYVDASGSVDVPIVNLPVLGQADIVVTGQNKVPYFGNFLVVSPIDAFVIYDSCHINDAAENNNGEIDAGENILLGIQVVNAGGANAANCVATLSSSDSYITITDNTESLGTVVGGSGTVYVADAFAFEVSTSVPDNHWLNFDLEVTGHDTWHSSFELQVHAPALEYVSYSIDDAAGGNGDNRLEPGETGLVIVSVRNLGSGEATATNGTLALSDSHVTLTDGSGYFGSIGPHGSIEDNQADAFEVSAAADCPDGHAVPIELDLITSTGYAITDSFVVTVGSPVLLSFDDFTVNQGWDGLGGYGEWMIDSAIGTGGDPADDHSPNDNNRLLGTDLTYFGTYSRNLDNTMWIRSPVLDCSQATGVRLSFYRWLEIEHSPEDLALLEVFNGSQWVTLFVNGPTILDDQWQLLEYDVSAAADGNPDFQWRFGIGPTDNYESYGGWNIDDITVSGFTAKGLPQMALGPAMLTDSLQPGAPATEKIWVKNEGVSELSFWLVSGQSWLDLPLGRQAVPAGDSLEFDISIDPAGLTFGDNNGVVDYAGNAPDNLVGQFPVLIHVFMPEMEVDSSAFSFAARTGESVQGQFTVSNVGLGRLDYDVTTAQDPASSREGQSALGTATGDWLSAIAPGASVDPLQNAVVDVFIDATDLHNTEYTGNITVTGTDPNLPEWIIPVTLSVDTSCCEGLVGDVNGEGGEQPTIGDIARLIDFLFIGPAELPCYSEADVNLSGEGSPTAEDITIGDISTLIDILFITGGSPPPCP